MDIPIRNPKIYFGKTKLFLEEKCICEDSCTLTLTYFSWIFKKPPLKTFSIQEFVDYRRSNQMTLRWRHGKIDQDHHSNAKKTSRKQKEDLQHSRKNKIDPSPLDQRCRNNMILPNCGMTILACLNHMLDVMNAC